MKENKVGKIKNFKYNTETEDLEITILIQDSKFKRQILREFDLLGKLIISGQEIYFQDEENAKL